MSSAGLKRFVYFLASFIFGVTQGLGINLVTANLPAVQAFFGATTTEASWLNAAYIATSATASLVLFKVRFQFGLRVFAEVGLILFVVVSAAHLLVNELHTAIVVRGVLGLVAAPLTSLAILYAFETLPQERRLPLGLPIGLMARSSRRRSPGSCRPTSS